MWLYLYLAVVTHILIIATLYLRIYHYISCDVGSRNNYHIKLYFIKSFNSDFSHIATISHSMWLYISVFTQFLIIATLSKNVKLCFVILFLVTAKLLPYDIIFRNIKQFQVSHDCDYLAMWLSVTTQFLIIATWYLKICYYISCDIVSHNNYHTV